VAALRDVSELLWPAVAATITALKADGKIGPEDEAAVKLCQRYARVIDQTPDPKQASVMWHLGAELHRVLESLGATPAARANLAKNTPKPAQNTENQLDRLRKARERRRG
jgi:hypothetical protein